MTRTVRFPSPIRGASDKIIRLANEFIDSNINSGPVTKQRRREQLTIFFRYFKGDIIDMDAAQYNAFIGWMRNEKKYRYETIHGIKIASIGFLRFLHRKGIRPEVEFKLQKVPRDQSRATAFSFAEYIRILDVACEARAESSTTEQSGVAEKTGARPHNGLAPFCCVLGEGPVAGMKRCKVCGKAHSGKCGK